MLSHDTILPAWLIIGMASTLSLIIAMIFAALQFALTPVTTLSAAFSARCSANFHLVESGIRWLFGSTPWGRGCSAANAE
jgi:hypothetical protein